MRRLKPAITHTHSHSIKKSVFSKTLKAILFLYEIQLVAVGMDLVESQLSDILLQQIVLACYNPSTFSAEEQSIRLLKQLHLFEL